MPPELQTNATSLYVKHWRILLHAPRLCLFAKLIHHLPGVGRRMPRHQTIVKNAAFVKVIDTNTRSAVFRTTMVQHGLQLRTPSKGIVNK